MLTDGWVLAAILFLSPLLQSTLLQTYYFLTIRVMPSPPAQPQTLSNAIALWLPLRPLQHLLRHRPVL